MTLLDIRIKVAEGLLSEYKCRLDCCLPAPWHDMPFRLTYRGSLPEKIEKETDYGARPLSEVGKARALKQATVAKTAKHRCCFAILVWKYTIKKGLFLHVIDSHTEKK